VSSERPLDLSTLRIAHCKEVNTKARKEENTKDNYLTLTPPTAAEAMAQKLEGGEVVHLSWTLCATWPP
jgi:hypothetical protein